MYQMCVQSLLYCGWWCITWQLTDESLTFYSCPHGYFAISWNCGGLLTLWFSPEWLCGSAIQIAQERRETAHPESKILHPSPIPLHFPSLSQSHSLIVFTVRLFVRLICSLSLGCAQYGGWVLPEARKVSKAVSTPRKFKVWNCRTAMGVDSSPILLWKAAGTVGELNRLISRNALKLNYMVSPCSSRASDSHSEGVKCKPPLSLFFYVDVTAHMCLGGTWMSVDY